MSNLKAKLYQLQAQVRKYRRFLSAVEQAPVSVVITDNSGCIEYVNPKFTEVTGYSLHEAVGQSPGMLKSGHHGTEVYEELWRTITTGRAWTGEFLNKRKDGTLFWEKVHIAPVINENRIIVNFIGVKEDITERKRIEEQLLRSEARYRAMFEEAGDGILICDQESNYLDANPCLLGMLGYTLDEFRKLKNEDLIHSEDLGTYPVEKVFKRLTSGEAVIIERRYRRKDGSHFPVQLSVRMVDPESGIVQALVRDISERTQTERLLQARMRLLEYAVSHSLNELLQKALDEVETLTDSSIAFYHFLEADQLTLSLQAWSTRTHKDFCTAQGKGLHYKVADAGVWADCIRQQRSVIHNDYKSLPHRKGMPAGHARVVRELVVPIVRGESIVAILGVGNKPADYNEKDVELVVILGRRGMGN